MKFRFKRVFHLLSVAGCVMTVLSIKHLLTPKPATQLQATNLEHNIQQQIPEQIPQQIPQRPKSADGNAKAAATKPNTNQQGETKANSTEERVDTKEPIFRLVLKYNRTTNLRYTNDTTFLPIHRIINFQQGCRRQYDRFVRNNPNFEHVKILTEQEVKETWVKISQYRFDIQTPSIVSRQKVVRGVATADPLPLYTLQIPVAETFRGQPTAGGTAFRVTSTSQYKTVCGFSDQFNGKYSFFCPVYGRNATLSVQLSHVDYQGYKGESSAYDKYIWHENVYIDDPGVDALDTLAWLQSKYHMMFAAPHGIWTSGEKHVFHTNTGEVLPVHRSFMCDCIRKFTIFLVGSSHLRNAYYCLYSACLRAKVMKNVMFRDGLYMDETSAATKAALDNATHSDVLEKLPKQRVIVAQSGSWDLAFRDFKNSTLVSLSQFVQNMSGLKQQGERVILIGAPSLPNQGAKPLHKVSRNNEIAAAFTRYEALLAERHRLEFVDMFSATFPQYRERPLEYGRPTHHYIAAGCRGVPGIVALELLFTTLCPATAQNYRVWTSKLEQGFVDEQARLKAEYGV